MTVVGDYTALLQQTSWAGFEISGTPMFLTYSFLNASPASNADPGAMGPAAATFQAFDNADRALARQALQEWADACGLVLLEVKPTQGDVNFGWYDFSTSPYPSAGGIAFNPGGLASSLSDGFFVSHREGGDAGGNIMINSDFALGGLPDYGLLLHEIGHALGLKHPFEPRFAPHDVTLDPALDTTANTVMSYTGASPASLGQLDRDAVAFLYGAAGSDPVAGLDYAWNAETSTLTRTGDVAAEILIGTSVFDSILGGGGADSLFGLDLNDTLNGQGGDDGLFGGAGNDLLIGGLGNDSIEAGSGNDQVNGQDGNDEILGGAGNDLLSGLAGDDRLGGGDGVDRLRGGLGNDLAWGDAGNDVLEGEEGDDQLAGGDGIDRLTGGIGADLLWGDTGNDRLHGGEGDDQLSGDDGRDQLLGEEGFDNLFGGAGNDTMTGGAGADWLTGGAEADRFLFDPGFGDDIVWDFQDRADRLAFSGIPGVTGIGSLSVTEIPWGPSAVATVIAVAGHGTVTLAGIPQASITAADMLFL